MVNKMVMILNIPLTKKSLEIIKQAYKEGKIIVYPTDTVYGIGTDPYNANSVFRIFEIKKRDIKKGFPVLVKDINTALKIGIFDDLSYKIVKNFWPGQVSILVKLRDMRLKIVTGGSDKIAIRVPDDEITLTVLKEVNIIIGTSANISGQPACISSDCVLNQLDDNFDVLIDAKVHGVGSPSTLVEVINKRIRFLREGYIKPETILKSVR